MPALKRKITKAEHDKLSDAIKELYQEEGEEYVLELEGYEDPDALRRARDREKIDNRELRKQVKDLQAKLDEIEGSDDRKKGDIEKIDNAWKTKIEKTTKDFTDKLSGRDKFIRKQMIDNASTALATKISTVPKIMSKTIAERLTVDFDGDEPALVVLDTAGKASKLSMDDLEKELLTDKDLKSILIGSKASGSGAPGSSPDRKPGSAAASSSTQTVDLSKLRGKDLVAALKERRASGE